ncbi:MAG: hypothetical protein WCV55_03065 [Candidatus Paceibacterota bacterium]
MNKIVELEKKPLFRFFKVIYILIVGIVAIITIFFFVVGKENKLSTDSSYYTCNGLGDTAQTLTDNEKKLIQNSKSLIFQKGTPENIRLSKECYKLYSGGKDPDLATSFEIQLFEGMQKGDNGKVYTISGTREYIDWHLDYLLLILIVEGIIFYLIRLAGLYIFGGKQAISSI